MSLKIDKVTDWAKRNGERVDAHWAQSLPSPYSNMTFGRSAFGLASDTFGLGKYTMGLSPTDLLDWDAIKDQATNWGLSKAGSLLTGWLASTHRDFIDGGRDRNQLLSGQWEGYRFNHKTEYRGYLAFAYPKAATGNELMEVKVIRRDGEEIPAFSLPFFENPKITESRSATYASQDIVNRNEPYRIWMGAKATKVNVNFKITLPHLMTFASEQFQEMVKGLMIGPEYQEKIMSLMKGQLKNMPEGARDIYAPTIPEPEEGWLDGVTGAVSDWVDTAGDTISGWGSDAMDYLFGSDQGEVLNYLEDRYELTNDILANVDHSLGAGSRHHPRAEVIIYSLYLLDLIRNSVIGSTKQTLTDPYSKKLTNPPIIFLTHGSLYNDDPFIATSYNIEFDGKSGYEELSLIPRVVTIKLTLESYDQLSTSQSSQGILKRLSLI
tara:strand:+ start:326 stop:1636 length:1311 start_codon:yes stop_codon:yes gene_type:complete